MPTGVEVGDLLGIEVKEMRGRGGEVFLAICPYCDHEDSSWTGTHSYNERKGKFLCLRASCDTGVGWMRLLDDHGAYEKWTGQPLVSRRSEHSVSGSALKGASRSAGGGTKKREKDPPKKPPSKQSLDAMYEEYQRRIDEPMSAVMRYLCGERGLTETTVRSFMLGETAEGDLAIPYFDADGELIGFKYRGVGKGERYKHVTPGLGKGALAVPYNIQNYNPKSYGLIICEGEIDCMTLVQLGEVNVVSLPQGAGSWKNRWIEDHFTNAQDIYLALDGEPAMEPVAIEIASAFGHERCQRVYFYREGHHGDIWKDANDALVKGGYDRERLAAIITHAKIHVGSPIDWIKNVLTERHFLMTGWPKMDEVIGGLPTGAVSFVVGREGSGKTTWVTDLIFRLAEQGHRCLFVTLDMPTDVVAGTMIAMYNGYRYREWLLQHKDVLRKTAQRYEREIGDRIVIIGDHADKLPEARVSAKMIEEQIVRQARVHKARFIVIDHYMALVARQAMALKDSTQQSFGWMSQQVDRIISIVSRVDAHLVVLNHVKVGRASQDPADATMLYQTLLAKEASNVFQVWPVEDDAGRIRYTAIAAKKIRYRLQDIKEPMFTFSLEKGRFRECAMIERTAEHRGRRKEEPWREKVRKRMEEHEQRQAEKDSGASSG